MLIVAVNRFEFGVFLQVNAVITVLIYCTCGNGVPPRRVFHTLSL